MEVIPVIDLKAGHVVHARQGHRNAYQRIETPLAQGSRAPEILEGLLNLHGFSRVYIADLDAIEGHGDHNALLIDLAGAHPGVEFWVDNGISTLDTARAWLNRMPGALVIGSESQIGTRLLTELHQNDRVILSLDFREDAFQGPHALLDTPGLWPARIIAMTLARVGAETGPDLDRVRDVAAMTKGQIYAAGGVRNATDLEALAQAGAAGALVATALHEGTITAEDLNALARP